MRWSRFLPLAFLAAGLFLIALAVVQHQANLALIVVFPVVWGSSAVLAGGLLLVVLGLFTLPLAWSEPATLEPAALPGVGGSESPRSGGVLLVGPIPFFWGEWRRPSRRAYWWAVAFGVALVVVALLFVGLIVG